MKISKDALWKGIIEDFFPDLMAFFYPETAPDYDYGSVDFLDKELDRLFSESKAKRRYADKLVKVKKKSGEEQWLLVHIEVQAYNDKDFPDRMFRYYYRIYDHHEKPIEALAILADEDPDYRPVVYEVSSIKTTLTYRYHSCKLLDLDPLQLEADPNPFALVMLVAWEALGAGKLNDNKRLELKIRLFRKMLERGYSRERIGKLTSFVKHYIRFAKPEMNLKFEQHLDEITQSQNPMGIIETIVQEAEKQATAKGRAKGKAEGKMETQEEMIKRLLQSEFFLNGMMTYQHIADLTQAPIDRVQEIHREIMEERE